MNRHSIVRLIGAGVLAAMGLALVSAAGPNAVASAQAGDGPVKRYIVVLNEPPLAQYAGGIEDLAPTSVDTLRQLDAAQRGEVHLDIASPAAQAYTDFLLRRQGAMINAVQSLAPEFSKTDWQYQYVLNGFVAQLTPGHANDVRRMRGVRMVSPVEDIQPEMDATKYLVGTLKAWEAAGGVAEAGAGARIGTLEAGNAVVHPFFTDEGMPPAPEGWPKARYMEAAGTTGTFTNTARLVNNKVVGFTAITDEFTDDDVATVNSGFALSAHGSHVLGTIGGRWGNYEIAPNIKVDMAGIAPMAHLFTYPVYGTTAEMVKAFEVMVEDEIDAVNLSLGTTTWLLDSPDKHPVSLAMSGATDAGLVVVGSAGNAGSNGRTSLSAAWKYNEDVVTVGNTNTNGTMGVTVSIAEASAPAALKQMPAGILGNPVHTAPITGQLAFVEGGGCAVDPTASGKIAVVERFDENAVAVGTCTYQARAQFMKDSGATAIVYLYFDRVTATASATVIALPGVALAARDSTALRDWLKGGNTATATLGSVVARGYNGVADFLEGSSSRGPGLNWSIKPDISAPGSSIYSSVLADDNSTDDIPPSVPTWPAYGGTSMSAPHVTGAAGLLRSMHPTWTARQVKSALVTTAEPSIITGMAASPRPADPTEGGPGRLDLSDAHDPKAFLSPPKLSFGRTDPGTKHTIAVEAESATSLPVTWDVTVEAKAGDAAVTPSATSLAVPAGQKASFSVSLDVPLTSQVNEHWGYVVLKESGAPAETARVLRLAYYTFVDVPAVRKNVLIVNWTHGATENYVKFYTDALDALGLTYTVWGLGEAGEHPQGVAQTTHPPYNLMAQHDLVVINTNMSPRAFHEYGYAGMFQYQNLPLGGGNMLIVGQGSPSWWRYLNRNTRYTDTPANRAALPDTWPHAWGSPSQNVGCEMCMSRYFAGFTPQLTATLSGRLLVPFPTKPDEPEKDVILAPAADADGPFDYSLDISTGAKAKDGAAGNQYRFASGAVARDYIPTTSAQITTGHGDMGDAAGVMERYSVLARPMWTYAVTDTARVVGTYIAGQQHPDAEVPWNAMFWGFGLEGVGEGGVGTVGRDRLMGDTFNFLAHNLYATAMQAGATPAAGEATVQVDIPATADQVMVAGAEIDWGDGKTETLTFEAMPMPRTQTHKHVYEQDGTYTVRIKYLPATGAGAAPVYAHTQLAVKVKPKGMYLPALLKSASFGEGNAPMAILRRDD